MISPSNLEFDKESHTYVVKGTRLPSVSEIIRYGGGMTDYSSIPKHILERAREIGNRTHETIEKFHEEGGELFTDDSSVNAYLDGYLEFVTSGVYKHFASEHKMYCECHWYAGTVDLVGWVNESLAIVDIKTTNKINETHVELQTAAYKHLAELLFDVQIEKRFVLHLKKSRRFNLIRCDDETSWPRFENLVTEFYEENE